MRHHPTGGEYGDGATDRLRDLTQRQNRQRDSRERPACGAVAQVVAHLIWDQAAVGSNPVCSTTRVSLGMILSWGGSAVAPVRLWGK